LRRHSLDEDDKWSRLALRFCCAASAAATVVVVVADVASLGCVDLVDVASFVLR
jgi:hypothetical protein